MKLLCMKHDVQATAHEETWRNSPLPIAKDWLTLHAEVQKLRREKNVLKKRLRMREAL